MFPRSSRQVDARSLIFRALGVTTVFLFMSALLLLNPFRLHFARLTDLVKRFRVPRLRVSSPSLQGLVMQHYFTAHLLQDHPSYCLSVASIITVCSNCRCSRLILFNQSNVVSLDSYPHIIIGLSDFLVLIRFVMFHCKLFKLPPSPCSSPRNVNLIGTNKETDRKVLLLMTFVFALFTQNMMPLNAR